MSEVIKKRYWLIYYTPGSPYVHSKADALLAEDEAAPEIEGLSCIVKDADVDLRTVHIEGDQLVDGAPPQDPTELEALKGIARTYRNQLLVESDWTDTPAAQARLTQQQRDGWAAYRDQLRNWTSSEGFPDIKTLPTKPGG